MRMKVRVGRLLVCGALLVAGAGCSASFGSRPVPQRGSPPPGEIYEVTITLKDGRQLPCVAWRSDKDSHYAVGGLDCDWREGGSG